MCIVCAQVTWHCYSVIFVLGGRTQRYGPVGISDGGHHGWHGLFAGQEILQLVCCTKM